MRIVINCRPARELMACDRVQDLFAMHRRIRPRASKVAICIDTDKGIGRSRNEVQAASQVRAM